MAMIHQDGRFALANAITGNADLTLSTNPDEAQVTEVWLSLTGMGLPFNQPLEPSNWQIVPTGNAIYTADIDYGIATADCVIGTEIRLYRNGVYWLVGNFSQEYPIVAGDRFVIPANTLKIEW
jgi:hypothetical protein